MTGPAYEVGGLSPDGSRRQILHVVESYAAGVASSISSYVRNTPEYAHHLLARVRPGGTLNHEDVADFSSIREMSSRLVPARREIRLAVSEISPDVLHAHSSFGGAFARLAVRATNDRPLVYTPHGYGFERQDVGRMVRALYYVAELALSANTSVIAGCSPREAMLSRGLFAPRVEYVPNVATIVAPGEVDRQQNLVVTSGRISAARDPAFFCEFADRLRQRSPQVEIQWVGGDVEGNDHVALEAAGIRVTGWLRQAEATRRVALASVYVHTGAWDGFPMSLLEAHQVGTAVVVRRSAALSDAPYAARTPTELAELVSRVMNDAVFGQRLRTAWADYLWLNSDDEQRMSLLRAYRRSARGRKDVST